MMFERSTFRKITIYLCIGCPRDSPCANLIKESVSQTQISVVKILSLILSFTINSHLHFQALRDTIRSVIYNYLSPTSLSSSSHLASLDPVFLRLAMFFPGATLLLLDSLARSVVTWGFSRPMELIGCARLAPDAPRCICATILDDTANLITSLRHRVFETSIERLTRQASAAL
jgi:hypothetical protein